MTVALAAVEYGTEHQDRPAVAILHGLFGSGRNWASIATRLAATRRVLAFDLRNHGSSPWADTMDYQEMAEDALAALAARGHRRAALLGHSMGGKVAMMAALRHPEAIARLIVVDIAPVAYPARHLDYVRAMRGLDLAGIRRRSEAEASLAAAVPDLAERSFLLQNLTFGDGHARWRLNLAAIEREMPKLVGFPSLPEGSVYPGPALFVGGTCSDYLLPEYTPAIRKLFPQAEIASVPGAGHWLHAERPDAFLAVVEPFLASAD